MVIKVGVYDLEGKRIKEIELPEFFESEIRPDLIMRAVLAIRTKRLQPKGKSPVAGRDYTVYNLGKGYDRARVARIFDGLGPAKKVAQAVGGLRVRAPTSKKVIVEEINKKEKFVALVSAIAATADPVLVQMRGHECSRIREVPVIIVDDFEKLSKTRDVRNVLKKLGVWKDIDLAQDKKRVRSGKGKMRGRKYKRKKGPLIVVSGKNEEIILAARNLEGVDVVPVDKLSVEHFAPGGHPGRLTLFTESALKLLKERIEKQFNRLWNKGRKVPEEIAKAIGS